MGEFPIKTETFERLLESDPSELYEQLGMHQAPVAYDGLESAPPKEVVRDFGERFFKRVNKDVYNLVCGADPEHSGERKKLVDAFGGGNTTFAATLAALLVSSFGWAPAIAAIVAALVVKLFFANAYGAMCEVWSDHLPA